MITAEKPTPLSPEELAELRAYYRPGYCAEPTVLGDVSRLLSTIDHYKALSTGRVEGRTPGTVEVCERHATGHDCSGEMDAETGCVDRRCGFYLCPIRAMVSP